MKLFWFDLNESYAGGGVLIAAPSADEAKKIIIDSELRWIGNFAEPTELTNLSEGVLVNACYRD